MSSRLRLGLACLATAVLVVPLAWLWWASLMPEEYSVMEMGYVDLGGGPEMVAAVGHGHAGDQESAASSEAVDITTLVEPATGSPDVRLELTAREETFALASGREVSGYTLNGTSPGPTLNAVEGDLVEVRLTNEDIPAGITLHWHGIDVPNAVDGVAGVTQDAVAVGETYTYRFVAHQVGTYWYHSHQVSHEQVRRGLLGAVVVQPARDAGAATRPVGAARGQTRSEPAPDVAAVVHLYDGHRTVNGHEGDLLVEAEPGSTARVRVINTDNGPMTTWVSGAPYRVVAVDGYDVNRPGQVEDRGLVVTAGGRADLEIVVPRGGARVELAGAAVVLGQRGTTVPAEPAPDRFVDLLTYGEPAETGLDTGPPDRAFEYVIGRRPGFHDGRPGVWWTINGHLWPDVPMFTVATGDLVTFRIENKSGEVHPMHLHGHHALVLSRDGVEATGAPWWIDSLNVRDGESYVIAFEADNPGIWMDHCHNLPHAAEGLVAHLMYAGYSTPYMVGGDAANEPE